MSARNRKRPGWWRAGYGTLAAVLAAVSMLLAVTQGAASTAGGTAATDPCQLITAREIGRALGRQVTRSSGPELNLCTHSLAGGGHLIVGASAGHGGDDLERFKKGMGAKVELRPCPGLGDRALLRGGAAGGLYVWSHDVLLSIVGSPRLPLSPAALERLARLALRRLER
ncbi:MAG TPA: hypothetical protein VHR45_25045 [Thermoanaerobaculia bacterium]|nr:hypothetical protein [Thermoanaerobaculia bacterium]